MLAHGGTAGAIAEGAFILIPMAVFAWLSRVSRKRREAEEAAAETEAGAGAAEDGDADTETPVS